MTRLRTSNRDLTSWLVGAGIFLAVYLIGCHFAHAGTDQATDSVQQVVALINLIMTGKYMPAVGAFLIALVAVLRGGLGSWVPWLRTKAGGYVLGFGSAAVLYVASALQAGQMSSGVIAAALAAGWVAAGGWEHARDLFAWLSPPPNQEQSVAKPLSAALVLASIVGLMVAGGLTMEACTGVKSAGTAVVDCTGGSGTGVVANVLATLDAWAQPEPAGCKTATGFDWNCVESRALAKGELIGGCALAELVQTITGGTKATQVESSWLARGALEDARAHWGGVTFRTAKGDL